MYLFNKFKFVIKESVLGITKNISKSFLQLLICFISLFFFSIVFGAYINIQNTASSMRDKLEISIFISDDATNEQIIAIEDAIRASEDIESYEYISKEEARVNGEAIFKETPEMLAAIEDLENPFPSSFTLHVFNEELTKQIAEEFSSMPGIEENGIKYGAEYMDKILQLSNGLKYGSYFGLAFFFVIAVFFMISIVNVILSKKEEENKIMYMIGASPLQIKLPSYIQGILLGLLSSSLAYFSFLQAYRFIEENFGFIISDISSVKNILFGIMLVTGLTTGVLATQIALRKFNKTSRIVAKKRKIKPLKNTSVTNTPKSEIATEAK